ncbi:MAG: hypothetical protein ABSF83_03750, partial [Nitrososphaerales archaeon]
APAASHGYPLSAQLSVKVYDPKGALVASETQNDDMVMNNFMSFLSSWLSYQSPSAAPVTFTMTNVAGAAQTLVAKVAPNAAYTCTWACEYTTAPYAGGYIAVGTGATPPTRSDFKLGAQYQSLVPVNTPAYDPSTGDIVFGAAIIAGTAATISEAGFFENWFTLNTNWYDYLMFHDTFPPVQVPAGGTISVQYTVQLGSTAYDNNLGLLLAAILANSLGTQTSVQLTPTAGSSPQQVVVYASSQPPACCTSVAYSDPTAGPRADMGGGTTGADSTIRVGTGSASVCSGNSAGGGFAQSRSSVNLCNPVLSYVPVNSYALSPYVAVTALVPSPAAAAYTEAGYFASFGGPTYTFLLIRNVFTTTTTITSSTVTSTSTSPLSVPADSSVAVSFEMSMS